MNCPTCNGDTKVLDSRISEDSVRRRRRCVVCDQRFTTMETLVHIASRGPKPKSNRPASKPKMQSIRASMASKRNNPRQTLYDDVEDYGSAADLRDIGIDLPNFD